VSVPPELQLLIINATILAVAYLGIYPSLRPITLARMRRVDVVLSCLSLLVAGGLFWDTGTRFSLLLFQTNWAVFALVTMMVMEYPLARWFLRKHGLSMFDDEG
jgi:hypothetical protein